MKEVEWGPYYGEGDIQCTCDNCGNQHLVECNGEPDFKMAQEEIRKEGWISTKVHGIWYDFCSEKCRNSFIKRNS